MSTEDIGGGLTSAETAALLAQGGFESAKKESLPIGTIDTMPGNALLALTGVKTLYVGYPQKNIQAGQFAWITSTAKVTADGESKTVRVPVIIDMVGEPTTRAKLSAAELKAAGYKDEQGLLLRVKEARHYFDRILNNMGGRDNIDSDKLFLQTAPASRITFHVATPADLRTAANNGHEVPTIQEAYGAVKDAVADLRAAEQLGRPSITDAVAFAQEQGADLTRAKQNLLDTYSREAGIGRSAA